MKQLIAMIVCGWLVAAASAATKPEEATKDTPWTNSLGMAFVPVPETKVLFCIWETRVQDFEAFVKATKYDATKDVSSFHKDGYKLGKDNWQSPGFEQTPSNAVCGVSWEDAKAFCEWLTKKERAAGLIGQKQSYRLPTDAEWTQAVSWRKPPPPPPPKEGEQPDPSGQPAMQPETEETQPVGPTRYPWGVQWPPTEGAGNFAGEEAKPTLPPRPHWTWFIGTYNDKFPRTAPVGSFLPTDSGLYDMAGNVWEWCEDFYQKEMNSRSIRKENPSLDDDQGGKKLRVLRGGSWMTENRNELLSLYRLGALPNFRSTCNGFRCVLDLGTGAP